MEGVSLGDMLEVWKERDLRSSVCVEQDVSVFQLLRVGTLLEVLFKTVLTDVGGWSNGRDGTLVDDGAAVLVFGCHDCDFCLCLCWCTCLCI